MQDLEQLEERYKGVISKSRARFSDDPVKMAQFDMAIAVGMVRVKATLDADATRKNYQDVYADFEKAGGEPSTYHQSRISSADINRAYDERIEKNTKFVFEKALETADVPVVEITNQTIETILEKEKNRVKEEAENRVTVESINKLAFKNAKQYFM